MAKNLVIEGLKDAVRHARGGARRGVSRTLHVTHPADFNVKSIRSRLGLTQSEFALKFGFSLSAVRNWEQGRRAPAGAHKNLLKLIGAMPEQVGKVLGAA